LAGGRQQGQRLRAVSQPGLRSEDAPVGVELHPRSTRSADERSIFATRKLWSLIPRYWLTHSLKYCADNGGQAVADVTPFLPWSTPANTATGHSLVPSHSV
jgi:hypothetical protein